MDLLMQPFALFFLTSGGAAAFLAQCPSKTETVQLADSPFLKTQYEVFLTNLTFIGQATPPPAVFWTTLVPILMMGLVLYFFILRPQRQKERHRLEMLANLKKSDRVITVGGLHGVVTLVKEKDVILQVDETKDVKVKVEKDAIISVEERVGSTTGEKHTEHKEKHKE